MKYRSTDRLFRDRLEQHETQPADGGWDRLESMLDTDDKKAGKKKRGLIWYSAAAAVLLIGLLYIAGTGEQPVQTAGKTGSGQEGNGIELADNSEPGSVKNEAVVKNDTEPFAPEENRTIASEEPVGKVMATPSGLAQTDTRTEPERKAPEATVRKLIPASAAQDHTAVAAIDDNPAKEELPVLDMQELPIGKELQEEEISLPDISVTKIETALASVEEEVKRQPVTISYVDAPDNNKESKRLSVKRIIGLAKDIKDGDVGIGDLRQAKENLLAGRLPGRSSTD